MLTTSTTRVQDKGLGHFDESLLDVLPQDADAADFALSSALSSCICLPRSFSLNLGRLSQASSLSWARCSPSCVTWGRRRSSSSRTSPRRSTSSRRIASARSILTVVSTGTCSSLARVALGRRPLTAGFVRSSSKTPQMDRIPMVESFNRGAQKHQCTSAPFSLVAPRDLADPVAPAAVVFLLSSKGGGTGLNSTSLLRRHPQRSFTTLRSQLPARRGSCRSTATGTRPTTCRRWLGALARVSLPRCSTTC